MLQQLLALGINLGDSPETRNRALVTHMVERINEGDVDGYVASFADQVINHGFVVDREMIRMIIQDMKDTFPDLRFEPAEILVDEEWVTLRMWMSGTHLGVSRFPVNSGLILGHSPTGRSFRCEHIHLLRIRDEQVHEHYACRDDVEMGRQLGVIPPLPPIPGMPPPPMAPPSVGGPGGGPASTMTRGTGRATGDAVEREVSLAG